MSERRTEGSIPVRPFQDAHSLFGHPTSFLQGFEGFIGFVQDKSQEYEIKKAVWVRQRFSSSFTEISAGYKLAGSNQHFWIGIHPRNFQPAFGEGLGKQATTSPDIQNAMEFYLFQTQVNHPLYLEPFHPFGSAQSADITFKSFFVHATSPDGKETTPPWW